MQLRQPRRGADVGPAAVVALADLDAHYGTTAGALAEVDAAMAEAGATLTADPPLAAVQAEIATMLAQQDAAIARLWAAIQR